MISGVVAIGTSCLLLLLVLQQHVTPNVVVDAFTPIQSPLVLSRILLEKQQQQQHQQQHQQHQQHQQSRPSQFYTSSLILPYTRSNVVVLFGKKDKRKGGGGTSSGGRQVPQEKQSVKDARFDAITRQFMFTLTGLTKILPDKSKTILNNIYLSFYPGAKIGVVGLNGSGKSTLLKIMAGIDTEYDGIARPLPGASVGYLSQEPELPYDTVQECVDDAVKSSQIILDQFNELSMKLADPDLSTDEMNQIIAKTDTLTNTIEAGTS
jgi:ABC-type glutathione transport system ATPase component